MQRIIAAVEKALENKSWHAALSLSLCIPDICSGMEGSKSDTPYGDWAEEHMPDEYFEGPPNTQLSGSDCYALRCAYLHDGSGKSGTQSASEVLHSVNFVADANYRVEPHRSRSEYHLIPAGTGEDGRSIMGMEMHCFCMDMTQAVQNWWGAKSHLERSRIASEMEDTMLVWETETSTFA